MNLCIGLSKNKTTALLGTTRVVTASSTTFDSSADVLFFRLNINLETGYILSTFFGTDEELRVDVE